MISSYPHWLVAFFKLMETTPVGIWVRSSTFGYPLLEIVHLIGISTLFGTVLLVDLSVLTGKSSPAIEQWGARVLRLTLAGFTIALLSGVLLLMARASEIGSNPAFVLKMLLLVLAGLNALFFHRRNGLNKASGFGKLQALLSILIWIAIIACGRMIAYV